MFFVVLKVFYNCFVSLNEVALCSFEAINYKCSITIIQEIFFITGLEDVDEFGDLLVKKLIPCPICVANLKDNYISTNRSNKLVHSFNLNICALAAVSHQTIYCPKHPDIPVPLNLLVPDLLLSDLPSELIIPSNELDFNADESNRLGEGGAGGVYLGKYKHKKVAIKQFHSATNARYKLF